MFTAPVTGVDISDFTLTRDGVTIPLAGASVTGSGDSYSLGGLNALTRSAGAYVLSVNGQGTGIADAAAKIMVQVRGGLLWDFCRVSAWLLH
jgi:hypothetical protein